MWMICRMLPAWIGICRRLEMPFLFDMRCVSTPFPFLEFVFCCPLLFTRLSHVPARRSDRRSDFLSLGRLRALDWRA